MLVLIPVGTVEASALPLRVPYVAERVGVAAPSGSCKSRCSSSVWPVPVWCVKGRRWLWGIGGGEGRGEEVVLRNVEGEKLHIHICVCVVGQV